MVAGHRARVFERGREPIDTAAYAAIVVASAVAGGLSGNHPTGTPFVDPIYVGLFAALVTAAAGTAGRATVLWLAAVAAAFSRGYVIFPALAALVVSFAGAFTRRPVRVIGATAGALAVQVALRLPHTWFHGGSALVATAAVLPCLVHGAIRLPRPARRALGWTVSGGVLLVALFSVPVAVSALLAHRQASAGTTAAEEALRAVGDGDSTSGTAQLRAAEADFGSVADRVGAWWTAGGRLVPVVAQQRKAMLNGAQVARDVSASAVSQAGRIDFARLHFRGSGVDLAQVADLRAPLEQVDTVMTAGLRRLQSSQSSWLVEPLASRLDLLTSKVAKAQRSASIADQAAADAPSLLGGDGTRHYLVAVMDPSESRGLGGLIVYYGMMTATNGHLTLDQFQDISKLNALTQAHGVPTLTTPAGFVARYGQNPAVYAQNVTYSPDLPTVTNVMGQLYFHAVNSHLDGMLVLDPKALASLLNITGGVQVAGVGAMDASNAQQILEKGQYAAYPSPTQQTVRRAAFTDAMKEILSRITSRPLPGPRTMSADLDPDVRRGDLLFWSVHPADQPLLERVGLAGSFPHADGGDLLGVVTSNAANNKIDAYLQRTITDHVDYNRSTGSVSATLQVALHNEAPSSGLSTDVIGSYAGSGLPLGTNRVWVSIYSPLRMTAASVDGKTLSTATATELGVYVYSGFVEIPAGGTRTVTVKLQGDVRSGGYGLHLYDQPTVLPDHTTVTVSSNGTDATWNPNGLSTAFRLFPNG